MWHSSPGAKILQHVLGPLVGLGQQHAVAIVLVQFSPQPPQDLVGLGEVLIYRSFALDQIGHRVEPQPVDPEIEPEPHHLGNRAKHARIVEI